jgi:CheY-like chemotaxis protein
VRVLVIDDNDTVRDAVSLMLQAMGHEAVVADGGIAGLKLVHAEMPDIIITDILMPDMEGIEAIFRIKQFQGDAKIIAMSGGGSTRGLDLLKLAHRAGAVSTLSKPFNFDDLAVAISTAEKAPVNSGIQQKIMCFCEALAG